MFLSRAGQGWGRLWGRGSKIKAWEPQPQTRLSFAVDVVNKAIRSCYRWFDKKHRQCMRSIQAPLINSLICLPMKFKFFCNIAKGSWQDGAEGSPGLQELNPWGPL